MTITIWKIAVFRPLRKLLDYLPAATYESQAPKIGTRVKIPVRNSSSIGIFLGVANKTSVPLKSLRKVQAVLDEEIIIDPKLLKLNVWASEYYHHPIGDVFCNSIPTLLRQGKAAIENMETIYVISELGMRAINTVEQQTKKLTQKQALALEVFKQQSKLTSKQVKENNISTAVLQALVKKDYIEKQQQKIATIKQHELDNTKKLVLNKQQQQALTSIAEHLNQFKVFLLHGITGSGKTEVYLRLIEKVIANQQQALVLIPEIGLTPQTIERFAKRFAVPIAAFHSNLTPRQRLDAWLLAKNDIAKIIIGTRSAIFSPLSNLGVIIVDEEHDQSFKQQEGFRYSARDLAIKRAHQENIPIVLGSATPSLESFHNSEQQRYDYLPLSKRAGSAIVPQFKVLNIRNQRLEQGLSPSLKVQIKKHLEADGQVIIFLNRRGFAPTLICHSCGWSAQCSRCDVRLTIHQNPQRLICHHCGLQQKIYRQCPSCNGSQLLSLGLGTERLEETLQQHYGSYGVARIDRDSTSKKGSFESMLTDIHQGKYKVLVGTQMLAKGHHFPNVTMVAIVDADTGFLSSDLRASERMGQLIIQVAGRAGRAEKPGEVMIQTRYPDNPLLQILIQKGYQAFAKKLLVERQQAQLPPFGYLSLFRAEAFTLDNAFAFLEKVKQLSLHVNSQVQIMGPVPAPMSKKAGKYRAQLLLQTGQRKQLHQLLNNVIDKIESLKLGSNVKWSLDVDPLDLF